MYEVLRGFYDTPPLWKKKQFSLHQFEFPEVELKSATPVLLPDNLRLGHQLEFVFNHLIAHSKVYDMVYHSLLVEEGKTRVGELDFILKERETNRFLHVELSYKFYIINPDISEPIYRLMGPNKRDMFYTKLDKLKDKQLPLLYHKNLQNYWSALDIEPLDIEQQCCFKAQLFTTYDSTASIRPLNTNCVVGAWIRFDDFNSQEFSGLRYYIPKKREWVIAPHDQVHWLTHYETLMEVNLRMVKSSAPMVWMQRKDGQIDKLFIVWW